MNNFKDTLVDVLCYILLVAGGVCIIALGAILCNNVFHWTSDCQAVDRANEYLEYTPMSFSELVAQLDSEFTYDDAIYGAANCGADWNVVAGRCAEEYIAKNGDVPRALLEAELMIKGFTEDQAEFACDYVGVK